MTDIAFIGLGNMGGPMAANLIKAGRKVAGFDLAPASRDAAKADGLAIAASALEAVKGAQVVVTMLPAGKHVLSVWTEILPYLAKGSLIIDCSTIDVESAVQAHALAAKQGIASVDAPVSGGIERLVDFLGMLAERRRSTSGLCRVLRQREVLDHQG